VTVFVQHPGMPYLTSYVLPRAYDEMVTKRDIDEINSGRVRFKIQVVRVVKQCGPNRLHFDHKSYTWDLELR